MTQYQEAGGTTSFSYDSNGNTTVKTDPSSNKTTYTYDYENRMTEYRYPGATVVGTYAYDGDGDRVSKTESGTQTRYLFDGDRVQAEYDGSWNLLGKYTIEADSYYSPLLSMNRGGTTSWYAYDWIGSTRKLVNSSQSITDSYQYDSFGNPIATSGSTVNPYRYVGALGYNYSSAVVPFLHVGARWYAPGVGRFYQQDPLDVESNRYVYVFDNPTLLVDPSGLRANCWNPITQFTSPECTGYWLLRRETWSEGFRSGGRSGYYTCYLKCMGVPLGWKTTEELYLRGGPRWTARIYYHFTDRRFRAWGKYSKALVPRLAERIVPWAERASLAGYVLVAAESLHCMEKCSHCLK